MRSYTLLSVFVLFAVLFSVGHSSPVPQDSQPNPAQKFLAEGKKFVEAVRAGPNAEKASEANEKMVNFLSEAAKNIEAKLEKAEKKIAEKLKEIRELNEEEPVKPATNPKAEEIDTKNEDKAEKEEAKSDDDKSDEKSDDKSDEKSDDKSDDKSDEKSDDESNSEETETEIVTEVVTEIIEEAGTTIVYEDEDEETTTQTPSSA